MITQTPPVSSPWEETVFTYWDTKRTDRLNLMPEVDPYVHSHFAVTDFDRAVLDIAPDKREDAILAELHRVENEQVSRFLDLLGDLPPTAVVLDSGCGRGGTSSMAHERFGCRVEGVDFSPYRLDCARQAARDRGCSDSVTFRLGNMTATGHPDHTYDAVLINEAAEHVDNNDGICTEIARLLKPGGLFALATWVAHDDTGHAGEEVAAINPPLPGQDLHPQEPVDRHGRPPPHPLAGPPPHPPGHPLLGTAQRLRTQDRRRSPLPCRLPAHPAEDELPVRPRRLPAPRRMTAPDIVHARISERLQAHVARLAANTATDSDRPLFDHAAAVCCTGGKLLHSRLCYIGWLCAGGDEDNETVFDACVAVELFKVASLLLDDIVDLSPLRRGQPSLHQATARLHVDRHAQDRRRRLRLRCRRSARPGRSQDR